MNKEVFLKQSVEKITYDNSLLAIIIRSDYKDVVIEFFTPEQMWPAGT